MGGWQVPGYAETGELGRGGTGRVVAAVEVASGQRVAIKYLADWLAGEARFREAFRAEAAILAGLRLPNVVGVRGYVEWAGGAAIVMDLVDGVSLRAMLAAAGPAGPLAALMVLRGSLLGLAGAHARGVVHRDYKPENVIVDHAGSSMLVDFGIAARAGTAGSAAGTPGYMAPEQWAGGPASPASDIYAAAVTYAECITGAAPPARPPAAAAGQYAVTSPAGSTVPGGGAAPGGAGPAGDRLAALIARATSVDPAGRPGTATEFLTELELAADQQYGPDWPAAGRAALARAAALTAGAAAGAAIGAAAAGAGQAAPGAAAPVARATTRLGRRAARRAARAAARTTGKAGLSHGAIAGIGAAAAVAVTVGAVVTAVIAHHHSPPAGTGATRADPAVLLGVVSSDPFQTGFGQRHPASFDDSDGGPEWAQGLHWHSWGDPRATSEGTAEYTPQNTADWHAARARVVAFDLGTCQGKRVYRAVEWYFPQYGQTFTPRYYLNTCTHNFVGVAPRVRLVYLPCCGLPGPDQKRQISSGQDYQPRTVYFDVTGSHVLENATWRFWNSTEAVANGTADINSCQPACAGGRYVKDPVILTLSKPQLCDGTWFWSHVLWHFPGGIPPGETQNDSYIILWGC